MRGVGLSGCKGQALDGTVGTYGGLEGEQLGDAAQAAAGLELQLPCQAAVWRVSGLSVALPLPELPPRRGLLPSIWLCTTWQVRCSFTCLLTDIVSNQ